LALVKNRVKNFVLRAILMWAVRCRDVVVHIGVSSGCVDTALRAT
jgi:hypothetical protein